MATHHKGMLSIPSTFNTIDNIPVIMVLFFKQ